MEESQDHGKNKKRARQHNTTNDILDTTTPVVKLINCFKFILFNLVIYLFTFCLLA